MIKSTIKIKDEQTKGATSLTPWIHLNNTRSIAATNKIHFSGANGFPVAGYESFLNLLSPHFNISAMDSRGAWPERHSPPKGFSMHSFADDLINGISQQNEHAVIGMGHSHGGQSTMIAALKRPELFSKLILIESASLPNPYIDLIYRRLPKSVLFKLFPFMRGSEMRKKVWPSRQAFLDRYRKHSTFKRFTDQALNDYAQHGLFERDDSNFELVFDPIWESYIFRKVEFMWKFLRKTTHPTLLIRAEHSNLYSAEQFERYNLSLPNNIQTIEIPNTYHLIPQEQPNILFSEISKWLAHQPSS